MAKRPVSRSTRLRHRTIHGHRRAFRLLGEGPPLLLLHGIGDSSACWLPVLADLARDHTVIAPDLLGHGGSAKPRADYTVAAYANGMRDLLDVLDIDRVTAIGHSLGGGVAAQFAYQFPDRCERLVLVATGGVGREVTPLLRLAAAPLPEALLAPAGWPLVLPVVQGALALAAALGCDLARDRAHVVRLLAGLPQAGARSAFVRTLRSAVDWRGQFVTMLDRSYLTAGLPRLLVWGDRDAVVPVEHAHRAAAAMPGARLELFPGAGHFPHHHDPARFAALVREFVATTEPARHDQEAWRARLAGRGSRNPGEQVPLATPA
ncbi:MAG TPA: alpha/beta hydrolase [Acidimicrobiales bacterium]|nr:alpha/beta hydrolase [Acidimicrobiales bacterium]